MKLLDSELKVLTILWREGELPASQLYRILEKKVKWKKTTTYTVLKRSIDKGLIVRLEPNFICKAKKTKTELGIESVDDVIEELFDGSASLFLNAFLGQTTLTKEEIEQAKKLLDNM